jgi:hypothetical protein
MKGEHPKDKRSELAAKPETRHSSLHVSTKCSNGMELQRKYVATESTLKKEKID